MNLKELLGYSIGVLGLLSLASCAPTQELGRPYAGWHKGEMDIHHIYTGRGESNLMIMPDGTTMLIDAGDYDPTPEQYAMMCELMPDSSRRAGEWISRYVQRVNPHKTKVDYMMISHFHNDHTGDTTIPGLKMKECSGDDESYKIVGVTQVGEDIQFGHFYDRGWSSYDYPLPIKDPDVDNYKKFVKYQKKHYGSQQEEFKVGALNQIKMLYKPKAYKDLFSIRNIAASGEVWIKGTDKSLRCYDLNPKNLEGWQNENTKSLAIRVDYGDFSYYAGGDLSGMVLDADGNKLDVEEKVGEACGPVDVCKVNHHGYLDATTDGFVKHVKARDYIFAVWDWQHIQPSVIGRLLSPESYEGKRTLYYTNIPKPMAEKYKDAEWQSSVCQHQGHVIVKVIDKGARYKIYVLNPKDEKMIVKGVYGPFESNQDNK